MAQPTVTLSSQPAGIVAAENPIVITLESGQNLPSGQDRHSASYFNFTTGNISEGFRVNFNLTSPIVYNQTFYARNFPSRDNYFLTKTLQDQYGNTVSSNTLTQITNSFAEALQNDPVISNNYYISVTGASKVMALAKSPGQVFTLNQALGGSNVITIYDQAGNVQPTTGITFNFIMPGESLYEGGMYTDYELGVELYGTINDSINYGDTLDATSFSRLTELRLPFNIDNVHRFDVGQICKSFVGIGVPDLFYPFGKEVLNYLKPFYAKYFDSFPLVTGQPSTKRKQIKGSTGFFWATNSSLPWEDANDLSEYTGTTSGGFYIDNKFVTTSPTNKITNRSQKELLYFLVPHNISYNNNASIKLTAGLKYWDGSTVSNVTLNTNAIIIQTGNTGNYGGLWQVNASYDNIGLDAVESSSGKKIKQIDFRLKSQTQAYLPLITSGSTQLHIINDMWNNWNTVSTHIESTVSASNPLSDTIWQEVPDLENFRFSVRGFSSTLISGASTHGDMIITFKNSGGTTTQSYQLIPTSSPATYNIVYTGSTPCSRINMDCAAVGLTGGQQVKFQFANSGGTQIQQLTPQLTEINYSEIKSFLYPNIEPSNIFPVVFQNNLGTYDTFSFIGLKEDVIDRSYNDLTHSIVPEENGSLPIGYKKDAVYDVRVTKRHTVNSGWLSQENFNWLMQMMKSSNVFTYDSDNETLSYLKLTDFKYSKNNQSNEYSIECSFLQTLFENSVTI